MRVQCRLGEIQIGIGLSLEPGPTHWAQGPVHWAQGPVHRGQGPVHRAQLPASGSLFKRFLTDFGLIWGTLLDGSFADFRAGG